VSWLLRDGDVLAALDDPGPGWARRLTSAAWLEAPAMVQTFRPAMSLDLAWCDPAAAQDGRPAWQVRRIRCVGRGRLALPKLTRGGLVVAPAGAFERWKLDLGHVIEIRL
jgi:hypothetical protein